MLRPVEPRVWNLSRREAQILEHLAAGIPRERVAYALGCSLIVLNEHVRTIHAKLGAAAPIEPVAEMDELQLV